METRGTHLDALKSKLGNLPLLALVAANLLPIYGVVAFGWDAFHIVLLYWAENLVIGFYNVLKIACARVEPPIANAGKLFLIPFFIVHYGGFAAVHGMFIFLLLSKGDASRAMDVGSHPWPCFLVFVQLLLGVIRHCWDVIPADMKYAIGALFLSHGVSFVYNYIIGGEYVTAKPRDLMGQPYSRVVVMHIAVLAGAFISAALGSPAGVLVVLVGLKTVMDVRYHLREHRIAAQRSVKSQKV